MLVRSAVGGLLALPVWALLGVPHEAQAAAPEQQITAAGNQASMNGPTEYFTGRVRIDPLWTADPGITASGRLVTFEPGTRSVWHTHPAGQRLVVTSGVGRVQEWGKPIQVVRPGDVVWCPAGVEHWHGAAPGTAIPVCCTGSTRFYGRSGTAKFRRSRFQNAL